jgi:predicted tellurium resistance membrane protein TerC
VLAAAAVAGLSVAACVLFRISVSYPVVGSSVATLVGLIAVALVVIRLLDPPGGSGVDREIGAWLGLACAIAVTVGGWMGMQPRRARRPASAH